MNCYEGQPEIDNSYRFFVIKCQSFAHQGGHSMTLSLLPRCFMGALKNCAAQFVRSGMWSFMWFRWSRAKKVYVQYKNNGKILRAISLISKPCLCYLVLTFVIELVLTLQWTFTYGCTFGIYQCIIVAYTNTFILTNELAFYSVIFARSLANCKFHQSDSHLSWLWCRFAWTSFIIDQPHHTKWFHTLPSYTRHSNLLLTQS